MITIASPIVGDEEIAAVTDVLKSGILAQGPKVAELEKVFADYCGVKYVAAVSSGTAAIHAALYAAGVGPGDEVITVPFSFIATVNPIIKLGATPKFVDIDPKTYNMDVKKLKRSITNKTKVIMPVHLYGQPADMDEIMKIAKAHGLLVVEDAAQAVGATYKGKKTGALGDIGCFSLYATKNIMCGEGGLITTDSEEFITAIRQFRQHGMSGVYQYEGLGYNYRMTDIQAAIAIEQLKKADGFNAKRQKNAKALAEKLQHNKKLELPKELDDRSHVYHQFTVRLKDAIPSRDKIVEAFKKKGVGVGVYYPQALHTIPHIAKHGFSLKDFPASLSAAASVLSLPIHPNLTDADLDTIAAATQEVV